MALEEAVASAILAFELTLVLLLSAPFPVRIRKQLLGLTASILRPLAALIPYIIFRLADVLLKYEFKTLPAKAKGENINFNQDRINQKIYKAQRNFLLYSAVLVLYWVMYRYQATLQQLANLEEKLSPATASKAVGKKAANSSKSA